VTVLPLFFVTDDQTDLYRYYFDACHCVQVHIDNSADAERPAVPASAQSVVYRHAWGKR